MWEAGLTDERCESARLEKSCDGIQNLNFILLPSHRPWNVLEHRALVFNMYIGGEEEGKGKKRKVKYLTLTLNATVMGEDVIWMDDDDNSKDTSFPRVTSIMSLEQNGYVLCQHGGLLATLVLFYKSSCRLALLFVAVAVYQVSSLASSFFFLFLFSYPSEMKIWAISLFFFAFLAFVRPGIAASVTLACSFCTQQGGGGILEESRTRHSFSTYEVNLIFLKVLGYGSSTAWWYIMIALINRIWNWICK